jgi:hypothetical protein
MDKKHLHCTIDRRTNIFITMRCEKTNRKAVVKQYQRHCPQHHLGDNFELSKRDIASAARDVTSHGTAYGI